MKKKLSLNSSPAFRISFIRGCHFCVLTFIGLLVLHGTGVATKGNAGGSGAGQNAIESLMLADDAFRKDNSPANRMALIKVLLTFDEKSLRIQAANLARQLIQELPADPEAYILYCKSAFLTNDVNMLQNGLLKLQKITSPEDFDRRWLEISNIVQHSAGSYPGSGTTVKVTFTSNFLRYAAYGFAAWASMLAVLLLACQLSASRSLQPNDTPQPSHRSGCPNIKRDRQHWHKKLLKWRRFSIYCSIPFILLLTAVIAMGFWHTFKITGSIPLKQVIIFGMLVLSSLVISLCCLKEINK
jgi:hypothetical protein